MLNKFFKRGKIVLPRIQVNNEGAADQNAWMSRLVCHCVSKLLKTGFLESRPSHNVTVCAQYMYAK